MLAEVRVGPQIATDGTVNTARSSRSGAMVVVDAHGRYREQASRGTLYSGAITGQVTTVGLNTTYTGLCLSNPVSSGVVLSMTKVGYAFIVAFAAGSAVGIMTGYNAATNVTHTTPVTPRKQLFTGAGGGVGLLDSAATLPTAPIVNTILAAGLTGAITTTPLISGLVDLEGSIELPPGAYAAIYTSTASGAAAGAFSFQWEEIPL